MFDSFLLGVSLVLGQGEAPVPALPSAPVYSPAPIYSPAPVPVADPAVPYAFENRTAAPTEEEVEAEPTYLLMALLEDTHWGKAMAEHRFSITGWTNGSYTASTASNDNSPLAWNYKANDFLLQQNWIRLQRTVDTESKEFSLGFRADIILPGSDYRYTLARGILNNQLTDGPNGGPKQYGIDPIAFYIEAYMPNLGNGVGVKVGRFFTPFGVESLEAVSTPLVSRSYAFNSAPPFTHTGFIANTALNDNWTLNAGIVLGNDNFIDPTNRPRFLGTIGWASDEGDTTVTFGTSVGDGRYDQGRNFNNINVFDLVVTQKLGESLNYTGEVIYGYQDNVPGIGSANWYSFVNYLFYNLTDNLTTIARVELFEDTQGSRTGSKGLYTAGTLGLNWMPIPSLSIRPEVRYDYNNQSNPFEGEKDLFTAALGAIVRW